VNDAAEQHQQDGNTGHAHPGLAILQQQAGMQFVQPAPAGATAFWRGQWLAMLRVQPNHLVRLLALAYPYFDGGGGFCGRRRVKSACG
jgi:hypothetical protein